MRPRLKVVQPSLKKKALFDTYALKHCELLFLEYARLLGSWWSAQQRRLRALLKPRLEPLTFGSVTVAPPLACHLVHLILKVYRYNPLIQILIICPTFQTFQVLNNQKML